MESIVVLIFNAPMVLQVMNMRLCGRHRADDVRHVIVQKKRHKNLTSPIIEGWLLIIATKQVSSEVFSVVPVIKHLVQWENPLNVFVACLHMLRNGSNSMNGIVAINCCSKISP